MTEYHGYGPHGYQPSPSHGSETNLDVTKRIEAHRDQHGLGGLDELKRYADSLPNARA